jgi:predicted  nucleic acid-binding Zn-ribbon protein
VNSSEETDYSHGNIARLLSRANKAEGELALLRQQIIKEQAERQRLEHLLNGLQRKYRALQEAMTVAQSQYTAQTRAIELLGQRLRFRMRQLRDVMCVLTEESWVEEEFEVASR